MSLFEEWHKSFLDYQNSKTLVDIWGDVITDEQFIRNSII